MGYNTTGQSHKNGNKGEKQVEGFFRLKKGRCFGLDEEYGEFIEIQQLGGTQNKDDSRAVYARGALGISTKNNTDGTFDWMNTTKHIKERFPKLSALVEQYKGKYKGQPKCEKTVEVFRNLFNQESQRTLLGLSSNEIRELLRNAMQGTQKQFVVVIHKKADLSERYKGFYGKNHPEYEFFESKDYELFLKQMRAKTSAQIWARDLRTGEEHKISLRVRLVLNNGVGALLGGKDWSSNPSSSPSFKIQQDDVDGLFEQLRENGHLLTESEIL